MKLILTLLVFCSLILCSCQKENLKKIGDDTLLSASKEKKLTSPLISSNLKNSLAKLTAASLAKINTDRQNPIAALIAAKQENAVVPTECSATQLNAVVDKYVNQFGTDEFALFGTYAAVNQLYSFIDESKNQYFGANGENTHLVVKYKRDLEKFWDMPNQIRVNGEHNSTLDNRDKIALIFILFGGLTSAEAYDIADFFISFNEDSPVFIETPLLSLDAFATTSKLIVLGDGIIQVLTETGVSSDVVVGGVFSHEWAHQVQFANWYDASYGSNLSQPERTRLTELEADLLSSYYLTHKRGATFNWKKVSQFLQFFYNIGDCAFTSGGHHGTPLQRMAASYLGYLIAKETLPHGHILSAEQMHSLFLAGYKDLISNSITGTQAGASLQTQELKAVYLSVLKNEKSINSILAGKFSVEQIQNLK